MKIRFRFSKEGEMKYIGHLDIMRYFQKAIRRAGIDVAYSQGYNPHQILSFASPLGLGLSSTGEYFDAELNSFEGSDITMQKLNKQMVDGIKILSVSILPDEGKFNAMASLKAAMYLIEFADTTILNKWNDFLSQEEIIIEKETKRSKTEVDIRPLIFNSKIQENKLELFIAAGSDKTIKPLLVISEYFKFATINTDAKDMFYNDLIRITRVDQFTLDGNKYISLEKVGEFV